jgi:6-pyruvoyltetrahydropterin/6-carboxytetrahydropterin synthase
MSQDQHEVGHTWRSARQYKYTSTKEYHDAFPCAYRQWRADSHCNLIHGYSFSMKFYFGTDDLDARNWAADYGGLKELKSVLESQFDHTLLVSEDDPELEWFMKASKLGILDLNVLPNVGCEAFAETIYHMAVDYLNEKGYSPRARLVSVEVSEHDGNSALVVNE